MYSHILICLQDENVTACLPLDHTSADYDFNTNLYGLWNILVVEKTVANVNIIHASMLVKNGLKS